jgi:RHS repeat-associated protein
MSSQRQSLLCQYRYDPLDRLINQARPDAPVYQRFYCKSRLATEIQGAIQHSIIQHGDLLLAQQQREGDDISATLLATDLQRSVLHTLEKNHQQQSIAYTPYGHRPAENGLTSLLGFNGERPDPVTGHYLLGNGYRAFNPVLMRFNSPDSLSPFGKGGMNSYVYCLGDPINLYDPNGKFAIPNSRANAIDFLTGLATSKIIKRGDTSKKISNALRRRNSSPSLTPSSPSAEELKKWDLIGYHGSTKENADSLMAGLDPDQMGSKGLRFGKGFYIAPVPTIPEAYARSRVIFRSVTSQLYSAYTQNFSRLKPGRDFSFRVRDDYPIERRFLEIVIREPAYNSIVIKPADIRRRVVLPKSYEAPF